MSHIQDIRDWMFGIVTPVKVIIAPYNGPLPTGDYIAINDIDSTDDDFPVVTKHVNMIEDPEDEEEEIEDPDNILYWTQIDSELVVSVNVYAANGRAIHAKLKANANIPPVRLADDSSIRPILASAGTVRNLTFLDDTSHKPRYQCDYVFRVGYTEEKVQPRVTTVAATGTLNQDSSQEMTSSVETDL